MAVAIVSQPARPVDVARPQAAPWLPSSIAGATAQHSALSAQELDYFTRYGGGAARASYGEHSLLLVRTSAPLRHLHAPDECLRGQGHRVRYLGQTHEPAPTALYRSVDSQGRRWRIAVTFVSDRGHATTSVGHAVWLWLGQRGTTWTMVQRISPWDADPASTDDWESHVARAFDLKVTRTHGREPT